MTSYITPDHLPGFLEHIRSLQIKNYDIKQDPKKIPSNELVTYYGCLYHGWLIANLKALICDNETHMLQIAIEDDYMRLRLYEMWKTDGRLTCRQFLIMIGATTSEGFKTFTTIQDAIHNRAKAEATKEKK